MNLAVRDLMRMFQVSEKTIYRWIKDKRLPAHKVHDQYRFNRSALLEWARRHRVRLRPTWVEEGETPSDASLLNAVQEGGIHYNSPGKTKEEAFDHLARSAKLPPSFSAEELKKLLLAREALASTGVGEGIAIPHVRDPIVLSLERSSVSIFFLDHPIDFGALDGRPVHTFFLVLSATTREHLRLLSKIAYTLHDPAFLGMLARREKEERLLAQIRTIEEALKNE